MAKKTKTTGAELPIEQVKITDLRPHPKNYVTHPDDEIAHIMESIRKHGIYKNVVATKDGTILAGHGVVKACQRLGMEEVPALRLDIDPDDPRAIQIVIGDNEISHLREVNDRALSELLKGLNEVQDVGLLGTGYDEMMLANLVLVTRSEAEIPDVDAANEWAGAGGPEYHEGDGEIKLMLLFRNVEDRDAFIDEHEIIMDGARKSRETVSVWWPPKERHDRASVKVDGKVANDEDEPE